MMKEPRTEVRGSDFNSPAPKRRGKWACALLLFYHQRMHHIVLFVF
jgi:hypothetical protein